MSSKGPMSSREKPVVLAAQFATHNNSSEVELLRPDVEGL
jgi:hypothetical protein